MHKLTDTPASQRTAWPRWQRLALWALIALVLALVFGLYLQPEFMVNMADQVWACF